MQCQAVEISHKSKLRHIGTFLNQDQAALANKIVRDLLKPDGSKTDSCPEDSAAEAEEKVSLAREAALEAVSRLEVAVHDQSSLEGGISPNVGNMILKSTRKRTHEGIEKIKESPKPKKSSTAHTDLIQTKSAPPKRKTKSRKLGFLLRAHIYLIYMLHQRVHVLIKIHVYFYLDKYYCLTPL